MAKSLIINYEKKLFDGDGKPLTETDAETGKTLQKVYKGTVTMNAPETVEEFIQMWGEEVLLKKAMSQVIIDARRLCYEADTPEEAQEMVGSWVPGVGRERSGSGVSKKALLEMVKDMPKEELAALIAKLQAGQL